PRLRLRHLVVERVVVRLADDHEAALEVEIPDVRPGRLLGEPKERVRVVEIGGALRALSRLEAVGGEEELRGVVGIDGRAAGGRGVHLPLHLLVEEMERAEESGGEDEPAEREERALSSRHAASSKRGAASSTSWSSSAPLGSSPR